MNNGKMMQRGYVLLSISLLRSVLYKLRVCGGVVKVVVVRTMEEMFSVGSRCTAVLPSFARCYFSSASFFALFVVVCQICAGGDWLRNVVGLAPAVMKVLWWWRSWCFLDDAREGISWSYDTLLLPLLMEGIRSYMRFLLSLHGVFFFTPSRVNFGLGCFGKYIYICIIFQTIYYNKFSTKTTHTILHITFHIPTNYRF